MSIHEERLQTSAERYIEAREKGLIKNLLEPKTGERLLIITCGSGDYHDYLKRLGCQVTVFDAEKCPVRQKTKSGAQRGRVENLPFSDDEFDIVTMIASLEFSDDPQKALMEAIRVCRRRIFIGVQNRYSLAGTQMRISRIFGTPENGIHLFSVGQLRHMVRHAVGDTQIRWGSVIFLPYRWYSFAERLEENIPTRKNPFGAFLGLSFPVSYRYRTIQDKVSPFKLGIKRSPEVRGAVRVALHKKRME